MNIGDTYSWTPTAFEGASGLGSFEKTENRTRQNRLHQRGTPLFYGGGRGKRDQAQREL